MPRLVTIHTKYHLYRQKPTELSVLTLKFDGYLSVKLPHATRWLFALFYFKDHGCQPWRGNAFNRQSFCVVLLWRDLCRSKSEHGSRLTWERLFAPSGQLRHKESAPGAHVTCNYFCSSTSFTFKRPLKLKCWISTPECECGWEH